MPPIIDRRNFLTRATLGGVAASTLAAPALAQEKPRFNWRVQSAYPRSVDSLWSGAEFIVNTLAEATDGALNLQLFAAGEIVPGTQATDAVSEGTVEMAFGPTYYSWGKDPAFALGTAAPFGLSVRAFNAYMWEAGGNDAFNQFLAKHNVIGFIAGNTGAQMGGWFRKEINTVEDMRGMKFRIGGFGGKVLERIGVVPQQIAAGDIYSSLEKGTIDAAEWVGPYDDEKMGFVRVAPYYYYPGWWEGSAAAHLQINLDRWNELPESWQGLIRATCRAADAKVLQFYDSHNPAALRTLLAQGAQLRQFNEDVLQACFDAAQEVYADISAQNTEFKRLWDGIAAFRRETFLYQQLSEYKYDSFMMYQQSKGAL